MASLGKITAELEVKFKDFVDGMGKAEDAVEDLGDEMDDVRKGPGEKLNKWFRGAAAIAIAKYGTDLFNLGADVERWGRNYETTFGDVSGALDMFIDDHNERFGVGEEALRGFSATAGQTVKDLGLDEGQAAEFVTDMLTLAGALSEFTGVPVEEAMARLTDGIGGRFEALKDLNITIDKADVAALLEMKGLEDLEGQARDLAEAQAILELAYADSKDELKLYEEGMGDAETAQKNMAGVIADAKEDVGQMVAAMAPLVSVVAGLFGALNAIPGAVPGFVAAMALMALGINPPLAVALALLAALQAIGQFGAIDALANLPDINLPGSFTPQTANQIGLAGTQGGGVGGFRGFGFPGAAAGGPINGPTIVGEQGPELFIPGGSGTVVPNHRMGGGVTVNVAGSVISEGDLVEAVRRGLRSDTIRGGSLEFA